MAARRWRHARSLFPWLLRGVDFDNDSAFMNDVVVPWCREARGDTLACLKEERPGVRRAEERCGRAPVDGLRPLRRRRNGTRYGSPLCGGPAVRQLLPAVVQIE